MKVIKKYVDQWWNQELNQCDFWQEFKQEIKKFDETNDGTLRVFLYQKHLDLLSDEKWGFKYMHTIECAYLRELSSKQSDIKFFSELSTKIKQQSLVLVKSA